MSHEHVHAEPDERSGRAIIKGAAYVSVFSVADSNRKRRQSDINCVLASM
jgi:hypothetical protein